MRSRVRQKVKGNRIVDKPCEGEAKHVFFDDNDEILEDQVCPYTNSPHLIASSRSLYQCSARKWEPSGFLKVCLYYIPSYLIRS
jgi:hypothetical protein